LVLGRASAFSIGCAVRFNASLAAPIRTRCFARRKTRRPAPALGLGKATRRGTLFLLALVLALFA
jgi:hypothetical protein